MYHRGSPENAILINMQRLEEPQCPIPDSDSKEVSAVTGLVEPERPSLGVRLKRLFKILGPGFITGSADDDPSGIATYSQSGAEFGYRQLWMALYVVPFMTVIQEISGRIGLVTGHGLSAVIRKNFSKKVLYGAIFILFVANTINIGADLGAMAASVRLLLPVSFGAILLFLTAVILTLEIFVSYKSYAKVLKYLTLSLFAYVITAFAVRQDWSAITLATFVPTVLWNKNFLLNIVAFLGTTISPYLFFWQSNEEVEEEVSSRKLRAMGEGRPKIGEDDVKKMRLDTAFGMFFSQFITFFIILTTAATLSRAGIFNIDTADKAALALRPIAGDFAFLIFTLGILGTGLLGVPVLAGSASYAVSEAFGWKEGLYRKLKKAHGFYGVITIATIIGLIVNFTAIPPFKFLYYAAALNGVLAPPLMVLMLLISNDEKIMGKEYKNSRLSNVLGWMITAAMGAVALALIWSLFA